VDLVRTRYCDFGPTLRPGDPAGSERVHRIRR
jgi:hypothetical protein